MAEKVYKIPGKPILMTFRRDLGAVVSWAGRGLTLFMSACAVLLIALPIASLVWRGIDERAWALVPEGAIVEAIQLSLTTTAVSMLLTLLLGTPLAYAMARRNFWGKKLVGVLVQLPIVLPPSVAGLALLITFGRRGVLGPTLQDFGIQIVFTSAAVVIAQTFVAMPFYIRSAEVGFRLVDMEVEQAAMVDGASTWTRFLYVTIPLASRSLITGALLSWARALGEFGATILFAGNLQGRTQTMPLLIYNIFERNIGAAIWTALILIALAALILTATLFLAHEDERHIVS
ncbi:ABC transporter permease [Aggregatilinea lenta]|uniref:ABC transporter permease n=1 Tax=Aggregatilinea lenta TaxID=913108 RepID=UPI000E5C4735|nr:ABC transporter permease [Aggregatilinea lenta]